MGNLILGSLGHERKQVWVGGGEPLTLSTGLLRVAAYSSKLRAWNQMFAFTRVGGAVISRPTSHCRMDF